MFSELSFMKAGDKFPIQNLAMRGKYVAIATGEFRKPRKGEWFLSGAIVEAYHTDVALSTKYHIATIEKRIA